MFQEPVREESSPFSLMTLRMAILEHQFQETLAANQAWSLKKRSWGVERYCEDDFSLLVNFFCYVFVLVWNVEPGRWLDVDSRILLYMGRRQGTCREHDCNEGLGW